MKNVKANNITTNNLTIFGNLISPITDLLGVSINLIDDNVNYYNTINTNLINNLTTTSTTTINNLNNFENIVGVSSVIYDNKINNLTISSVNLDTNANSFKNLVGVSVNNLQMEDNLLQGQINNLVVLGVSENIFNYLSGVSSAIMDSKLVFLVSLLE